MQKRKHGWRKFYLIPDEEKFGFWQIWRDPSLDRLPENDEAANHVDVQIVEMESPAFRWPDENELFRPIQIHTEGETITEPEIVLPREIDYVAEKWRYLAMDCDGNWFFFTAEPDYDIVSDYVSWLCEGQHAEAAVFDLPVWDCPETSLHKRTEQGWKHVEG